MRVDFHKVFIHIFCVISAVCISACGQDRSDSDSSFIVSQFYVSGYVHDFVSHESVSDVKISISAYNLDDPDKENPIFSGVVYSGVDGYYSFINTGDELNSKSFVELILTDDSDFRTVHYRSFSRQHYLSSSNPAYNPRTRSYQVTNNDFNLRLED